jgi:SAM-dependent MidA family methyltransferase
MTDSATTKVNALSLDQQQITASLQQQLRARIRERGPMPFSEYMQACLYEPGLGYYVNGLSKLGADGDFVTAPELSARFAGCLARQAAVVLNGQALSGIKAQSASSDARDILEFGAGTGRLACDVLQALDALRVLPERYLILEVSGSLAGLQQQLLKRELQPHLYERIEWLSSLPTQFNGVVLANEVFDAFPVERFTIANGRAKRVFVDLPPGGDEGFIFTAGDGDRALQLSVELLQTDLQQRFADGFTSEYCGALIPWWQSLADILQQGLVLVCDYGCERAGYYAPSRSDGTLRCFVRHGVHNDPLVYAGVQDITADVDFTALTQAAVDAGFELEGYTPMSQFMLATGVLADHQNALADASKQQQLAATSKLKQLLLPQEMGERFMVAGYSVGVQQSLSGFKLADWSRLL